MFNRKKAIVPYSNNNKIKPSDSNATNGIPIKGPDINTNTDILDQMRKTQVLGNAEYLTIALLKDILLTLNKIEVNTRSSAVSNEFVGKFVSNKFKWF